MVISVKNGFHQVHAELFDQVPLRPGPEGTLLTIVILNFSLNSEPRRVPPGEEACAEPRVEEVVGVALLHVSSVVKNRLAESKQLM